MCPEREETLEKAIVKAEGIMRSPHRLKERTRWECFKYWLFPHIGKSKELAEKYAEAKVAKEMNEAHKLAEEAAEIAAQKDLKNAKKTS